MERQSYSTTQQSFFQNDTDRSKKNTRQSDQKQQSSSFFQNEVDTRSRKNLRQPNEKKSNFKATLLNPDNRKIYQIILIIIFILYIWIAEFSNSPLIIKSLVLVTLIITMIIVSIVNLKD